MSIGAPGSCTLTPNLILHYINSGGSSTVTIRVIQNENINFDSYVHSRYVIFTNTGSILNENGDRSLIRDILAQNQQCQKPQPDETGDDANVRCADFVDHNGACIVQCLPGFVVEGTSDNSIKYNCNNGSFDKEVKKCVCETCCDKSYENVENARIVSNLFF